MRTRTVIELAFALTLVAGCATGARPSLGRPAIDEYMIDSEGGWLMAKQDEWNVPLTACILPPKPDKTGVSFLPAGNRICYALMDADYRSILRYITTLESRLNSCEASQ